MDTRKKVCYIINFAPAYRDVFLSELGKFVDLTVVSFNGITANLKDPEHRTGYKYIELKQKRFLNMSFNYNEFKMASGDFDVIIVGYNLRNPFRMLNLIRKKRVILEGLIYGKNENFFIRLMRKFVILFTEGVLVYSNWVKTRLEKEVSKPVISFNNTSYSAKEIKPLPFPQTNDRINIIWVGRYQQRKKIERLAELAEQNKKINVRLIGPGIREKLASRVSDNLAIYDSAYGSDLEDHFAWSHAVFNPGGAGLLVMNAGRFGRPIIIDNNSHHGPEIQMAVEAEQPFVDFSNYVVINEMIDEYIKDPGILKEMGKRLSRKMENYTIEYMARQYLKGINGQWN